MSRYIDADELYVDWYDSFVADDGTEYDNVPLITKGQIDDAPSIDIEPKRGKWIYVTVEEWLRTGRDYGHHCSECDEINESGESNFCPNCGAKMKGVDNEQH